MNSSWLQFVAKVRRRWIFPTRKQLKPYTSYHTAQAGNKLFYPPSEHTSIPVQPLRTADQSIAISHARTNNARWPSLRQHCNARHGFLCNPRDAWMIAIVITKIFKTILSHAFRVKGQPCGIGRAPSFLGTVRRPKNAFQATNRFDKWLAKVFGGKMQHFS